MGSLIFLGRSLVGTPYEDLSLSAASTAPAVANPLPPVWQTGGTFGAATSLLPLISLCEDEESGEGNEQEMDQQPQQHQDPTSLPVETEEEAAVSRPNAFVRAAHLFGSVAFAQLGLSSIDPLRCALASGLRVLPKLRKLQRAFAWFSQYSPMNSNGTHTFPVSALLISFVRFNHFKMITERQRGQGVVIRLISSPSRVVQRPNHSVST